MAEMTEKNMQNIFQIIEESLGRGISKESKTIEENLGHISESLKYEGNRNGLSLRNVEVMIELFCVATKQYGDYEIMALVISLLRCFRNAVAGNARIKGFLDDKECLFKEVVDLTSELLRSDYENGDGQVNQALRCVAQFLGNAAGNHQGLQTLIWDTFSPSTFSGMLQYGDAKLSSYTCMAVYQCLHDTNATALCTPGGHKLFGAVLDILADHDVEWGLYIVEKALSQEHFFDKIYMNLSESQRILVIEILQIQIKNLIDGKSDALHSTSIAKETIQGVAADFSVKANDILQPTDQRENCSDHTQLVRKYVDVLCSTTAHVDHFPYIQKEENFLQVSLYLLHSLNLLGKVSNNEFSAVDKVFNVSSVDESHVAYGLKKDLIQIIGNMAYKNKVNQDKIRELGGITLILDHTNIDAKNPFIIQWSIFAIRNLCEHNLENQSVVANMKLEGVADDVESLRRFGIEASMEEGKIVIKPTKKQDS